MGDSLAGLENWYYTEILGGAGVHAPGEAASALAEVTAEDVRRLLAGFTHSVSYLVTAKEGAPHAE